jgi:hypothetical protein
MLGGPPDPSYWYSRPSGAFKPPAPASSVNGNMNMYHPFQHAHHLQALQHYQQQLAAGGMLHRPPVGTDPRDSKNPLSISQLTGSHSSSASLPNPGSLSNGLPDNSDLKSKPKSNFFVDKNRAI